MDLSGHASEVYRTRGCPHARCGLDAGRRGVGISSELVRVPEARAVGPSRGRLRRTPQPDAGRRGPPGAGNGLRRARRLPRVVRKIRRGWSRRSADRGEADGEFGAQPSRAGQAVVVGCAVGPGLRWAVAAPGVHPHFQAARPRPRATVMVQGWAGGWPGQRASLPSTRRPVAAVGRPGMERSVRAAVSPLPRPARPTGCAVR